MDTKVSRPRFSGRLRAPPSLVRGGGVGLLLLFAAPVARPTDPLPPAEQKRVNEAIGRGVAYLRRTQQGNGPFGDGVAVRRAWPVGFAALPGLTLLECGTPPADLAVQKATRFVRQAGATLSRTYEISLALLFLDRLGEKADRPLIRSLALRLMAGQSAWGGWGYTCPILQGSQEQQLLQYLRRPTPGKGSKKIPVPPVLPKNAKAVPRDPADNSNTQFALLALWAVRRYDLPLEHTISRVEQRFRSTQLANGGWGYSLQRFLKDRPYGSMTCVGLLGLAIGRGATAEPTPGAPAADKRIADEGITKGLGILVGYLGDPTDPQIPPSATPWGPNGTVNLYFLWSVERVGILCDLKTIGGKDWYRWGVGHLLPAQKADGSWIGRGSGGAPVIDTCFALLFLKRAALIPGLREALQRRLIITDPGPNPNHGSPNPSPGERPPDQQGNPETPP